MALNLSERDYIHAELCQWMTQLPHRIASCLSCLPCCCFWWYPPDLHELNVNLSLQWRGILRIPPDQEHQGLDASAHGGSAYNHYEHAGVSKHSMNSDQKVRACGSFSLCYWYSNGQTVRQCDAWLHGRLLFDYAHAVLYSTDHFHALQHLHRSRAPAGWTRPRCSIRPPC